MFDYDNETMKDLKKSLKNSEWMGDIKIYTMDKFPFGSKYDMIIFRWCLGYLTDTVLLEVLIRAKHALKNLTGEIIVQENISHKKIYEYNGYAKESPSEFENASHYEIQTLRSEDMYEEIFKKAGLKILRKIDDDKLIQDNSYYPITAWKLIGSNGVLGRN